MPSYTFAATANAAIYCNVEPWFFDINQTLNLDLNLLENTLKIKTYIKQNSFTIRNPQTC